MPIERILIELADVSSKIDNVRSLLDAARPTPLEKDDREHIEALLARLNAQKKNLEDQLRTMVGRRPPG